MEANAKDVAAIDNFTIISTDGASAATKQTGRMLTEGLSMVKDTIGSDLGGIASGLLSGSLTSNESATETA